MFDAASRRVRPLGSLRGLQIFLITQCGSAAVYLDEIRGRMMNAVIPGLDGNQTTCPATARYQEACTGLNRGLLHRSRVGSNTTQPRINRRMSALRIAGLAFLAQR